MAEERNIFQKIGDAVTDYAPGIAGILALVPGIGTVPAAALGAVAALGKTLGLGTQAKPEEVLATIQSMPDSELKLKFVQAEQAFQVALRDKDIEELRIELADIQNARSRQIEHEKVTGKSDVNLYILSWVIVIGFLMVIVVMLFVDIPEDQTNVLFALLGTLGAGFMLVLQYFYGTNKSSEKKTNMIYNSTPNMSKKDT